MPTNRDTQDVIISIDHRLTRLEIAVGVLAICFILLAGWGLR